MLLAIDIGNTDLVFGLFEEKKLIETWRIASDTRKTADEYGILLCGLLQYKGQAPASIDQVILSSVVPPLTPIFQTLSKKYFSKEPMVVTADLKTGLTIKYTRPEEVGSDRIVNAAAAYRLYGGPLVIVDLGTATTFCAVTQKGEYLGGAIAPGMALSADALFKRTAKLPKIEVAKPESVIGKDTVQSMQSGLFFGYIGLINEIVDRIQQEIGSEAQVLATGGLAGLIAPECRSISLVLPTLTLEGLMIIYHLNACLEPGIVDTQ